MKILLILPLLISCSLSLEVGDCVETEYPYISGINTPFGKVVKVFEKSNWLIVENTLGLERSVKDSLLSKTACENFEKFKENYK